MMATIELPKDAEGREIPLDVEFLYNANGEAVKPCSFTFMHYDGFGWEMHLVGAPNIVYDPKSFYLTQPDSWEKLEEDLRRASERDAVTSHCRYFNTTDRCANCPIYNGVGGCTHKDERAFGDILDRIRKLRGED